MKKLSIIFIQLFLCMVTCHAQEKLFDEAIKKGRQSTKFYVLQKDKSKMIRLDELVKIAQKRNYIVGEHTLKTIHRFGDVDESIATLDFLPVSEYDQYIFSSIIENDNKQLTQFTKKGSAYLITSTNTYTDAFLIPFNDVMWDGEIVNNSLHGYGIALFKSGNSYYYLKGEFCNGFPCGTIMTKFFDSKGVYCPYNSSAISIVKTQIGKMSDGLASIQLGNLYGFVSSDGRIKIKGKYEKVLSDFSKGLAEVVLNGEEIIIDQQGTFIDYTNRQKELFAAAERKRQEEERIAEERRLAEEARLAEEKRLAEKARREKEVAEKKAFAEFKRKYGFSPNVGFGYVLQPGRTLEAVDAWLHWHNPNNVFFPIYYFLQKDNGSLKGYRLYIDVYKGFFWTRNGVIISVTWP